MDPSEKTTVIKVKCANCGLDYAIYTYDSVFWASRNPMCPGCTTNSRATVWREELSGPIREYIPGNSPLLRSTARKGKKSVFDLPVRGIVI